MKNIPLLACAGLEAGYGASQVLFGIDFHIMQGEVVTLLGRNGMGKSTTIKTIIGALKPSKGDVRIAGESVKTKSPDAIARLGVAIVPEGRHCFPNLTVREHLIAFAAQRNAQRDAWTMERIYAVFPRLREREHHYGNQLSGGEQQMLAVGRALMTNPQLLLLDEPMEGLAPIIVEELAEAIRQMCAQEGLASVVVEQHPVLTLAMTDE
ncbi:MAG: ABC transporter ATP-binding protein, partial [Comamonas sp.]